MSSLNIDLADELTRFLNAQAVAEAQSRLKTYASDLLREAGRLETTSRNSTADPQITSSMVADADLLLRRGYRQAPRSLWLVAGKIISPLGALAAGFFIDPDKLKEPLLLLALIVLIIVTVTATVLTVVKE
jgi:hypothetical protein